MNRLLVFAITLLLFAGCAQIVEPTGGPKDVTPPKPKKFEPENKSIHFTGHKIRIEFDEYIQLKSLDKQLVISPPLKIQPTVIVNGKTLEINIKDTLHDNTTYTFNFGNAIADVNEGNQMSNFQYIVSTGDHLDSLSLTGTVHDAFTGDASKGAYVLLFSDLSDSAIYKKLPSYIGLVSEAGAYRIENVREGKYRAIALAVPQGDYNYHPYAEEIGFAGTIDINGKDTANFNVFMEVPSKLKLVKAKAYDRGEAMLVFNKPADSLSMRIINLAGETKPYTYIKYSSTRDTVFYYVNTPVLDSLRFIISKNNTIIDTAFVHSFPNNSISAQNKKAKPVKLLVNSNAHDNTTNFDFHDPVIFRFTSPVLKYNLSKIQLTHRKDTLKFTADTSMLPMGFIIKPEKQFESDSSYKLVLLPGAFTDMSGFTNDTSINKFKPLESTYFGSLKFKITLPRGNYIVQILDAKNNIYKQEFIHGSTTLNYDAVIPQAYRVRLIIDENNNGKWDAGNYLKGIQPEKVLYYSQSINVRSNWEVNQSWEIK